MDHSYLSTFSLSCADGQVETLNQLMNAYFLITFTEWCWVWMDGIWSTCRAAIDTLFEPDSDVF